MNTTTKAQHHLLRCGIKPSLQRIAIAEYLLENRIHPTADDIYNALCVKVPTLSKTTVYNTMRLFADQGVVTSLMIDDKNIRFDIDTSCHAHFICCGCNKVLDIPVDESPCLNMKEIGDLRITETHLYYKGYCKTCRNKNVGVVCPESINQ